MLSSLNKIDHFEIYMYIYLQFIFLDFELESNILRNNWETMKGTITHKKSHSRINVENHILFTALKSVFNK